ncbi:hypothetical protein BEL05_04875 [Shewanella colwelliana]|uniref:Holin of 3TMs, for gene-transfer release n=1 Tax=Shewanella colwelliana TaxID=23 RepID=A0A1E5IP43_SHECO|nr:hypothetical protein [Shewanella colwelliana]OEG72314.1 hypothetical protein BEL05_04875 [Shewanella colwelliana]
MGWLKSVLSFLTNPIADLTGGYRERQRIAAEMTADVATAENNLKIAKFNAKAKRLEKQEDNDFNYDQQVLENDANSVFPEIVKLYFIVIFSLHFIPQMQPYMAKGWEAVRAAPWYFEFIMIGLVVSTFGLMRLFRAFWRQKEEKKPHER